jgi:hypothetical protein
MLSGVAHPVRLRRYWTSEAIAHHALAQAHAQKTQRFESRNAGFDRGVSVLHSETLGLLKLVPRKRKKILHIVVRA